MMFRRKNEKCTINKGKTFEKFTFSRFSDNSADDNVMIPLLFTSKSRRGGSCKFQLQLLLNSCNSCFYLKSEKFSKFCAFDNVAGIHFPKWLARSVEE